MEPIAVRGETPEENERRRPRDPRSPGAPCFQRPPMDWSVSMAVLPGFLGGAYQSRSPLAAAERLVNLYVAQVESHSGQEPEYTLYGTPGYRRYCVLPGAGGVRRLYTAARGRCFAVQEERLYELFAGGTFLQRGTLTLPPARQPSSMTGPVSMSDNGGELVVVDGQHMGGWSLRLSDNLWRPITGAGFVGANRVDFFDGFFVFDNPFQPQQIYISGL